MSAGLQMLEFKHTHTAHTLLMTTVCPRTWKPLQPSKLMSCIKVTACSQHERLNC